MNNHPEIPEIDIIEAKKRIDAGATFIDVREDNEFREVRIPGAKLIPLSEFADRYEAELSTDSEIVVHCRSGQRSADVTLFLMRHGYQAINMRGGILAWEAAELPIERGGNR
ncbi:MAG: rhodanese-like domain-containing protein [Trueperaceae bacterium]|nr:MAG: rhodanese-like domain-containing protein [Trueperaceae bacterium]